MSIAEKLITIANNTPSVCEKLKSSKTSVSGSAIAVNDVNATVHDVDIKLTSDTVTNFSGVAVSRYGKNLIKPDCTSGSGSGVSYTTNENGEITLSGTATADYTIFVKGYYSEDKLLNLYVAENMVFSGCPSGGSSAYRLMARIVLPEGVSGGRYPEDVGNGSRELVKGTLIDYFYISIGKGANVDGLVFKPQLEVGTVKTDFEPYQEPQVKTATADGTVSGITSVSPNMTLISTNENVVINAEYISKNSNADTEKIKELNEAFANAKAVLQELRV